VLPTFVQCSSSPWVPWPTPRPCTLWVPLQSCLARFTIILTECVSNPAKFALSYLLIDVYLTSHFPILNLYSAHINLWLLYVGPIVLFWWCYKFEKKNTLSPISLPWLVMLTLGVIRRFTRTGWPLLSYLKSRKFYGNVTVIALLWLVIQNVFTMLTVWWKKNCWPTHSLTAQRGTPLLWPSCRTSLALYLSESSELCISLQWMMLYRVNILFGHEEAGKWTVETGLSPARRQDRVQTKC
jgi:hypothetical protein